MLPKLDIETFASTTKSLWELIKPKARAVIYPAGADYLVFELCNVSNKTIHVEYVGGFWKKHWYHRMGWIVFLDGPSFEKEKYDRQKDRESPYSVLPDRNLKVWVSRRALSTFLIDAGVSGEVRLQAVFRD